MKKNSGFLVFIKRNVLRDGFYKRQKYTQKKMINYKLRENVINFVDRIAGIY